MKLNWGTKIALLYGIFILIVLSMVFVFMTKDVDLVSNKYYDDGINYQEKINDMKRSESLLEEYEQKLGLVDKFQQTRRHLEQLSILLEDSDIDHRSVNQALNILKELTGLL
jgi:hypothetical protein